MKHVGKTGMALAVMAMVVFGFISCQGPTDPGVTDPGISIPGENGAPRIIFDNSAGAFQVGVYPSADRMSASRIGGSFIAGGARSTEIDFLPSPQGFSFFPRYFFSVENIGFHFDSPSFEIIIPASGTITISISSLSDLVAADTFLNTGVHLYIRNNGTAALRILRGGSFITDENGLEAINPRESMLFRNIPSGDASVYQVSVGAINFPFPSGLTFEPGHIYVLDFDGSEVSLVREPVAITLANAEWGHRVTFNANGGLGIPPLSQRVREGTSFLLPGPGTLSREGYSFGGWNTRADGSGQNFSVDESFTPPGNVTLFARWTAFQVDFDINEGTGTAPAQQQVPVGISITLPDDTGFSRPGFTFVGWNTRADGGGQTLNAGTAFVPIADTTLYAVWSFGGTPVPGPSLPVILAWLRDNARNNGEYVIELSSAANITNVQAELPSDRSGITITLRGNEGVRNIGLSGNGALFAIGSGITLVLDDIVLTGGTNNISHLVGVGNGGTLIMNSGSMIANNNNISNVAANRGGGVFVNDGGRFVMLGGQILGNGSTEWNGGGVHVASGGVFDMRGGTIAGNNANIHGGGVYNQGTFRISDGTIYGHYVGGGRGNTSRYLGTSLFGRAQRGRFMADGAVFTLLGTFTSTNNSISVVDGDGSLPHGYDSTITVRVEGIPERYFGNYAFVMLESVPDEYIGWEQVAWSNDFLIMGSSITFTMFCSYTRYRFVEAGTYFVFMSIRCREDREVRIAGYDRVPGFIDVNPVNSTFTLASFTPTINISVTGIPEEFNGYSAWLGLMNLMTLDITWTWEVRTISGGTLHRVPIIGVMPGSHIVALDIAPYSDAAEGYWLVFDSPPIPITAGENTVPWSYFDGTPSLEGNINITGTAQVGQTLGVNVNNLGGTGTISFEWVSGGVVLGTGSTLPLTSAHEGMTINVAVTREGYSGTITAIAVGPVTVAPLPPLLGSVTITGTLQMGQMLTANTAAIVGSGLFSFQWMRGTTPIGTNSGTYALQQADVGYLISVIVSRAGNSGSVTSLPVGPVLEAVPPTIPRPADAIFDLATEPLFQNLAEGTTNYAQIFATPQFITRAGGNNDVAFEVIRGANRNLLRVTASSNWAGFDLNHAGFGFRAGDIIRISGIAVTANQMLLNTDHDDWRPLGNYAMVSAGHAFMIEHTLTAPDVNAIVATNPQSIRVRGNHVESDGPATFIVTELTVGGQRDDGPITQPGQTTITVTGIPGIHNGRAAWISLFDPITERFIAEAFGTIAAGSITVAFPGVSPGNYFVDLEIQDDWGWWLWFGTPEVRINAGPNVIPFGDFIFADFAAPLSEPLEPSERTAPGRSRSRVRQ